MRLDSLHLKNIRSYRDQTLHFPDGTVLLSGDIGCGKTSLLLAMEFALFGLRRGAISGDGLLRHGENEGYVEFSFTIKEKKVSVRRALKRTNRGIKQEAGYLIVDGVRYDCTATELKTKIFDLLGYPQEFVSKGDDMVYRYTVYTPQEEMKSILFANPQERLHTLRRVLGIDRYSRIKENASMYSKELRGKMRELQGSLQEKDSLVREKQETEEKLLQAQQQIVVLTKRVEEEKLQLQSQEAKLQSHKVQHDALVEKKEKHAQLTVQIKDRIAAYNQAKEQLQPKKGQLLKLHEEIAGLPQREKPDLVPLQEAVQALQSKLSELKKTRAELTTKRDSFVSRMQQLNKEQVSLMEREEQLTAFSKEYSALEPIDVAVVQKDYDTLQKEATDVQVQLKTLTVQHEEAKASIDKVDALEECPTCLQHVSQEHKVYLRQDSAQRLESLDEKRSTFLTQQQQFGTQLHELSQKLELGRSVQVKQAELKGKVAQLEQVQNDRKSKGDELARLNIELSQASTTLENLAKEEDLQMGLEGKQKELEQLRLLEKQCLERKHKVETKQLLENQVEQLQLQCADIKKQHEEMMTSMQTLGFSAEEFTESKQVVDQLQVQLDAKKKQIHDVDVGLAHQSTQQRLYTERKVLVDSKLEAVSKREMQLRKLTDLEHWMSNWFSPLMSTMEKHVMVKINREFNELFKIWFQMLVEDSNLMVRIDDEFTPLVIQNGYEMQAEHLSGGEKTAVALAYRLALNKVINTLVDTIATRDVIILDEPTDGFSSEQLDRVKDVLDELHTKQTILVSHDEKVESFVETVVNISKTEHESVIE